MPAFTFEKITPPGQAASGAAPTGRRSALGRLIDRLALARLQKSKAGAGDAQASKSEERK